MSPKLSFDRIPQLMTQYLELYVKINRRLDRIESELKDLKLLVEILTRPSPGPRPVESHMPLWEQRERFKDSPQE